MTERHSDKYLRAILDWIREDVPLAAKMNLMPHHADSLVNRLRSVDGEETVTETEK